MFNIRKSRLAEQDLIDIWLYTSEQWNEEQADFYLDDLNQTIRLLSEQPLISRERDDISPPVRIHHHNRHIIVYSAEEQNIYIVRVLHDSMDIQSHI